MVKLRGGWSEVQCQRGTAHFSSLLVLTSKDLTLCEEMQEQEAIGVVKCGNDPVVSAGAREVCVG